MELASNPQLIFLDEPTTGLDSAAARKVMTLVKKLTMQGRSVMYVSLVDCSVFIAWFITIYKLLKSLKVSPSLLSPESVTFS